MCIRCVVVKRLFICWRGRGWCSLNAVRLWLVNKRKKATISTTQPFGVLIKNVQAVDRLPSISNKCHHFHDAHVSHYFQINNNKLFKKNWLPKKRRQILKMEYCGHFTVINSVCRHHFWVFFWSNWVIYYSLSLKWCWHKQMKAFLFCWMIHFLRNISVDLIFCRKSVDKYHL